MSKHLFGAETPRTEVFEGRYSAAVTLNLTDDNPAAREAFRTMIRRERAEAWREGRDSLALDIGKRPGPDGMITPTPNPYEEREETDE